MKIYITRDISSEYAASDLYEDSQYMESEAEVTEEFWKKYNLAQREYWNLQDELEKLYEAGKSTRGDKNKPT